MEFIRVAVTDQHIRVDTGMSAASTLPVIGKLQKVATSQFRTRMESNIQSRRKRYRAKGLHTPSGGYIAGSDGGFRNFDAGLKQGQRGTTVSYGSVARVRFSFEYEIQPYQWQKQEDGSWGRNAGNWEALVAGEAAFLQYFNANIDKVIREDLLVDALTPTFT